MWLRPRLRRGRTWPPPRLRRGVISMSWPRRCVVISEASPSSWPCPTSGSGPSVPLHDLAERGAQVVARAPQVRMHGEGAPEEQGRLVELAQHQMAEALAREGPEVVGIAGEGLSTIRNGGGIVLGHVTDGGPLVPSLREGRGRLDEAGEGGFRRVQILPLHRLDPVAEHPVEPRVAGAVPHPPESVGSARGRRHIVASKSVERLLLRHRHPASLSLSSTRN